MGSNDVLPSILVYGDENSSKISLLKCIQHHDENPYLLDLDTKYYTATVRILIADNEQQAGSYGDNWQAILLVFDATR